MLRSQPAEPAIGENWRIDPVNDADSPAAWPAVVTLYLLAPAIAELLSGSTPILRYFLPTSLILNVPLYGSGAVLVREIVRRRGLGWPNIALLGAAYGVLEEGLVITSWFNPHWPGEISYGSYGRWLDINWIWAFQLTCYHAVVSITIPIVLTELIFPAVATRPWVTGRHIWVFTGTLLVTSLAELAVFGFVLFRGVGYRHPPPTYFVAVLIAGALVTVGVRVRPAPASPSPRPPPPRSRLLLTGFSLMTVQILTGAWMGAIHSAPLALLVGAALVGIVWRGLLRWSARDGWGDTQRLALVSGALAFFAPAGFLEEFVAHVDKPMGGQALVGPAAVGGLVVLMRVVSRRSGTPAGAT